MKIFSGGQTGVDRAGLDVAIELGIAHGGWCPKGRMAEDGRIPEKYELQEIDSRNYAKRTIMNVLDSSATLIITRKEMGKGTLLTKNIAEKNKKPLLIIQINVRVSQKKVDEITEWLNKINPQILNIAGPRESTNPGIYTVVFRLLKRVFEQIK
jgi:Circularly permutated YpsA SLOG family